MSSERATELTFDQIFELCNAIVKWDDWHERMYSNNNPAVKDFYNRAKGILGKESDIRAALLEAQREESEKWIEAVIEAVPSPSLPRAVVTSQSKTGLIRKIVEIAKLEALELAAKHIPSEYNEPQDWKCLECGTKFNGLWSSHIRSLLPQQQAPTKCAECGMDFPNATVCKECGERFDAAIHHKWGAAYHVPQAPTPTPTEDKDADE